MADDSEIAGIFGEVAKSRLVELALARAKRVNLPPLTKIFSPGHEGACRECLTPGQLVKSLGLSTHELAVTQIHRELRSGRVRAICEEVHIAVGNVAHRPKWVSLDTWIWKLSAPLASEDFWETGYFHIVVPDNEYGSGEQGTFELFGVRFGFSSKPGAAALKLDDPVKPGSTLSKAEAENFCRAIVAGWPDASQDWAHAKAVLFYPDKSIPRDWFRSILRSIRGHRNPGKLPKNRQ